jgi:hypothetical protein
MLNVLLQFVAQKLVKKDYQKLEEAQKAAADGDKSKIEEYKGRNLIIFIIMMP